jgi:hypothetical protein
LLLGARTAVLGALLCASSVRGSGSRRSDR